MKTAMGNQSGGDGDLLAVSVGWVPGAEPTVRVAGSARPCVWVCAFVLLVAIAVALPAGALAERASQPTSATSGRLDVGGRQACALLASDSVRCWGYGGEGELGYGNTATVGDDETPGSVGPVNLGVARTATTIASGDFHTCALLAPSVPNDSNVRCWGFGGNGRLGYGNTNTIGDDETPGSAGPVDLGTGRTAVEISAGGAHTCAVRDDGKVLCWGYGFDGELGYSNTENIGDNETPGSVPTGVDLGPGRATAISVGSRHACALLDNGIDIGKVRCWGLGGNGELGYMSAESIGDNETPGSVGPVNLGRRATAISAGDSHTCAVLEDGSVRCWGYGANGQLGYANTNSIGVNETPASAGPVNLGGRATAISAGGSHTCAVLEDGSVRCWGYAANGQLGYANTNNIGDNETPSSAGPINLGEGGYATAISAGDRHTCVKLADTNVRCWGYAANGRLGYCDPKNIGDDETPGSAGPLALETPGPACPPPDGGRTGTGSGTVGAPTGGVNPGPVASMPPSRGGSGSVAPLALEAQRARDLRSCMTKAKRTIRRQRASARRACSKRYGRTPGAVRGLTGRAASKTKIVLSFIAPGTDGTRPPAARAYLVKQSPRAIDSARDFARTQTLCKGSCSFKVTRVGAKINLAITDLRPNTTYYYAVAARDNVSKRLGPRSRAIKAKTL